MSLMGNEVRALQYDDQGEPQVYETDAMTVVASELESAMDEWALAKYTTEELEAEIDRRMLENSPYKDALKSVYFPETLDWLDEAIAKLHPETDTERPF